MTKIQEITFRKNEPVIGFTRKPAPGEHHFSAEASSLFGPLGNGRYLPDIIRLTVEASGNTRDFYGAMTKTDREGDVEAYIYVTNDEAPQMRFAVIND